jgi:hypothetical protein
MIKAHPTARSDGLFNILRPFTGGSKSMYYRIVYPLRLLACSIVNLDNKLSLNIEIKQRLAIELRSSEDLKLSEVVITMHLRPLEDLK